MRPPAALALFVIAPISLVSAIHAPSILLQTLSPFSNATFTPSLAPTSPNPALFAALPPPPECPPCNPFNCVLPAFPCLNTGSCNPFDGKCVCPAGYGGEDCAKPLCGSLADGQNRFPRKGDTCECDEGWGGINCNVCETNKACSALVLRDPATGLLLDDKEGDDDETEAVCYKDGYAVKEMFQICDVTNRKIIDLLPDRPPQVTFTCDVLSSTCGFQFWIGQIESFYCGLSNCTSSISTGYETNSTIYEYISVFLTEEIKGPSKFSMKSGQDSKFEEPAMNQLINDIFGDSYITLACKSGECMHVSEVPGFVRPPKPNDRILVIATIAIVAAVLLLGLFLFWYFGRGSTNGDFASLSSGRIRLSSTSNGSSPKAPESHVPASLQFDSLSYTLPSGSLVLDSVTGSVQPGEIMAVIGASGAGKSTLLDLLARKAKTGVVSGEILVNGKEINPAQYRRLVGFVDQEDTLMGTLTVYETVLYSALLRLPRKMELEEKKYRVLETLNELGILGIRDSRIGESGQRSISGGEKRRVSIACELVTSPSVLFLDEPTSGLDSYNAFNVIECLVQLSRTYKRTVVFTIHQPRSNIVALFDKLVLLAGGKMLYSGKADECQSYFAGLGWNCPMGFNIADYLIDLTMQSSPSVDPSAADAVLLDLSNSSPDTEQGIQRLLPASTSIGHSRPDSALPSGLATPTSPSLAERISSLAQSYSRSSVAGEVKADIERSRAEAQSAMDDGEEGSLNAPRRAGWWEQFTILSGRAFKNLYRNPMLMLSHYVVSVVVACICAFLFSNLTADIPGFQNRLGLFFFILSVFGFGCLTTLNAFASERLLFTRERANGYYSPFTYFAAKLLFDIVPLRVVPPFVLGAIVYGPVGLVATVDSFWRFILVLVLFNLTASSAVLLLGMLIRNAGVANLVGSLVMLFNLLFAGLLINKDKLPASLQWLETISFFHAAFEALLINEVRYLSLKDHRYGVDIEVPAATILSLFGFQASAFWFPDISLLVGLFIAFTGASFVALVHLVKERR